MEYCSSWLNTTLYVTRSSFSISNIRMILFARSSSHHLFRTTQRRSFVAANTTRQRNGPTGYNSIEAIKNPQNPSVVCLAKYATHKQSVTYTMGRYPFAI